MAFSHPRDIQCVATDAGLIFRDKLDREPEYTVLYRIDRFTGTGIFE